MTSKQNIYDIKFQVVKQCNTSNVGGPCLRQQKKANKIDKKISIY